MPNTHDSQPTERPSSTRSAIDPVHIAVLGLCALALVLISWHYLAA